MMNVAHTPELLSSYLKTLRLPAMLRECPTVARQAAEQSATYELFLQQLTELEVQQRQAASIGRRLKHAGFPVVKELGEFDFAAAPKLNKKRLLDLAQRQPGRPGGRLQRGRRRPGRHQIAHKCSH